MSKRKNTLNDLEEFLKLQASTLVPPQPVETAKPIEVTKAVEPVEEITSIPIQPVHHTKSLATNSPVDLLEEMKRMASQNKSSFYDHIIKAAEAMTSDANDILLINTALYLKHGDNWKSGIEEYWKKRKSSMS